MKFIPSVDNCSQFPVDSVSVTPDYCVVSTVMQYKHFRCMWWIVIVTCCLCHMTPIVSATLTINHLPSSPAHFEFAIHI